MTTDAQTFDPNQVTVTATAVQHLNRQIAQSGHKYLRLGVKESGCNGFMYQLDYIDQPASTDKRIDVTENLSLYIAEDEWPMVRGTQVDYITEGLNATLQFKNANAESYCGCGESFSVAS